VKSTHHLWPRPSRTSTHHSVVWHRTSSLASHATKCPHEPIIWHRTSALARHSTKCPWHRTSALTRHAAKRPSTTHRRTSHRTGQAWKRKCWPARSCTESPTRASGERASSQAGLHTAKETTGPCRAWKHVREDRWARHLVVFFELLDFSNQKPFGQLPLITNYSNSLRPTRTCRRQDRDVHIAPGLCAYILDCCTTRPDQWADELGRNRQIAKGHCANARWPHARCCRRAWCSYGQQSWNHRRCWSRNSKWTPFARQRLFDHPFYLLNLANDGHFAFRILR